MNMDSVKQILVACVADDAPVEALFQAGDILK
jgi:hypothetical protein